jgi:hypothetical protein
MPLPMVHLAVAIQLGERYNQFPSPDFLLGSIAPDAIHMRPGNTYNDKHVTHLTSPADTPDHARVHDLLLQYTETPAFTAGYAAHLLTDRLWIQTTFVTFRASLPPDVDDAARRTLYYQETDQIDCNLHRDMSWRPTVWAALAQATAPDFPPWLTNSEIHLWRERTMNWFDDPGHNPHISPQYVTDALVANFIQQAAEYVANQFLTWQITLQKMI